MTRVGHAQTDLRIIGLTANAMETGHAQCLEAGMNDHVGKPFNIAELVAAILRLTGKPDTQGSEESVAG